MSDEPWAGHDLVFLGGLHRSGTTFVARALAAHPSFSGFAGTGAPEDEGEHLQSVYPDSWEFGGVGRFAFAPEMHMTETSPLVSARSRAMLWSEWSRWWDLSKEHLVEKSPPNMLKMRFLQALYANSSHVLITRHPVAVVGATLKWRRPVARAFAPHRLVEHWVRAHELAFADVPQVKRVHILRYEDLTTGPERELGRLSGFLGLAPAITVQGVDASHNQRYFELWSELRANPVRRPYLRWIERRYEPQIRRFGYSFADVDRGLG